MNSYDYSIYYRIYHDETDVHATEKISDWIIGVIRPYLTVPEDSHILDVGCGFGYALSALLKLGYKNTTGLELSPEQAQVARNAGHSVVVSEDSIAWMRLNPEKFDFVLLLDVLEHIPVAIQIDFMRAVNIVLRPAGKVLITVPNANAILSARWLYNDYTHCNSFTEHSLCFVLRNAGFNTIWIDSKKGIGRFPWRLWNYSDRVAARKWIVRWCWLQIFKAEVPHENISKISFDLNMTAVATKEL